MISSIFSSLLDATNDKLIVLPFVPSTSVPAVGAEVGSAVGSSVGSGVGSSVGSGVGSGVGSSVGSSVGSGSGVATVKRFVFPSSMNVTFDPKSLKSLIFLISVSVRSVFAVAHIWNNVPSS